MADLTGVLKYFPTAHETFTDNLSGSISALAVTVPVTSASEYADGDVVVLTVDPGTANEATFTGTKASGPDRFVNCVWTEGNLGVGHSGGATVIDYISATHFSMMSKGIKVEHKDDGKHGAVHADSVSTTDLAVTGSIAIPTITGNATVTGNLTVLGDTTTTGGINPRVNEITTVATLTPNIDTYDQFNVTAIGATLTIGVPSGTPLEGQSILFRFKDDGTARTLSWNAIFRAIGVTLPTTTVANKTYYIGAIYNDNDTKWDVIAVAREA